MWNKKATNAVVAATIGAVVLTGCKDDKDKDCRDHNTTVVQPGGIDHNAPSKPKPRIRVGKH